MKRIILFIVFCAVSIYPYRVIAQEYYVNLDPYPYTDHVLGEDLVIKGDTNHANITLGLYYPEDRGYNGYAKFVLTISRKELMDGYLIKTDEMSRLWPEGVWTVRVQNGSAKDEIKIAMSSKPSYDRTVIFAEYSYNTLTSLTSYKCRGILFTDNVIEFKSEDNTHIKIFSWDNLRPVNRGQGCIYIARYNRGFLTDIKTYHAAISSYGNHISVETEDGKEFKLFYWNDNLNPF